MIEMDESRVVGNIGTGKQEKQYLYFKA